MPNDKLNLLEYKTGRDKFETKTLIAPTVHLNGTGVDDLVDAVKTARQALRAAFEAVNDSHPNGRDYYPQGDEAIGRAEREHQDRCGRVHNLLDEYDALYAYLVKERQARMVRTGRSDT